MLLEKILFRDSLLLLTRTLETEETNEYKEYSVIPNYEEIWNPKPFTMVDLLSRTSCQKVFKFYMDENPLSLQKLENINPSLLLEILSKYDTTNVYGILVKHQNKVFNPMHVFGINEFLDYIKSVNENDFTFSVYTYMYDEKILNKPNLDESYIKKTMNELAEKYFKYVSSLKKIRYKVGYNCSLECDEDEYKNAIYAFVSTDSGDILFNKDYQQDSLEENDTFIIPVTMCSNNTMTYPYYGLLAVKNSYTRIKFNYEIRNEYREYPKVIAKNLSRNFISGNIGESCDGTIFRFSNKSDYEDLLDVDCHRNIEAIRITQARLSDLLESYIDFDSNDDDYTSNLLNHLNSENDDSSYYAYLSWRKARYHNLSYAEYDSACIEGLSESNTFEMSVCLGEYSSTKSTNIDVLKNMNLDSMYVSRILGPKFIEEAIANQLCAQSIYSSFLEQSKNDLNKKLENI